MSIINIIVNNIIINVIIIVDIDVIINITIVVISIIVTIPRLGLGLAFALSFGRHPIHPIGCLQSMQGAIARGQ
eukprot:4818091-Karenia_brevis.AAC.1